MSLKRHATRRDATEPAILRALAKVGADYLLLDPFDVLVLFRGRLTMLDCKSPKGRPTRNQDVLVQRGWPLVFVETVDEAMAAIGAFWPSSEAVASARRIRRRLGSTGA